MANVLVVDDEADIRVYLKMMLGDNGHTVETAESAAEARGLLKQYTPDVMILDIIMPKESGIQFYKELRSSEKYKGLPVIFLSAVVRHREEFEKSIAGLPRPNAYMDKPFDNDRLLAAIKKLA